MEKLGIATADLLRELKAEYHSIREEQSKHIKLGSSPDVQLGLKEEAEAIKARIDELEAMDGGKAS